MMLAMLLAAPPAPQVIVTARTSGVPAAGETDFDALSKAVTACDRAGVSSAVTQEGARRGEFLLEAYADQRDIAAERGDLSERRLKLAAPIEKGAPRSTDTIASLALATQALDDRQHALEDARALDQSRQEMLTYFRQLYLTNCQARSK